MLKSFLNWFIWYNAGMNIKVDSLAYEFFPLSHCNLCGEVEKDILFSINDALIPVTSVICKKCGLIYLKETLTEEAAHQFYSSDEWRSVVYAQKSDNDFLKKLFREQVSRARLTIDFIESIVGNISGKRCLDIGCATGGFVHVLRDAAAVATGVEPSSRYSEYGRQQHKLDIVRGSFENLTIEAGYDLVLCVRTFNHLLDPSEALAKIRAMMASSGYLYLEVLNFPHAIRRKSLNKCIKIDHPYMFSVNTLTGLLKKCGFEIIALDCDLDGIGEFGSLNHIHVVARIASSPKSYSPTLLASIEAKSECFLAVGQYLSSQESRDSLLPDKINHPSE